MKLDFSGFDWDRGNWEKSLHKHGVSWEEAEEACLGTPLVFPDERHSTEKEKRYVLLGETKQKRLLLIAFTMRGKKIRVISARPMSQKERRWYDEEKKKTTF